MPTSSSRSVRISSLRIPCEGVVAMRISYPRGPRFNAWPSGPRFTVASPMEQPALIEDVLQTPQKIFVRDLADGQAVDSAFVVRDRARRQRKSGDEFLKLQLGDVTGAVEAVVWDGVADACEASAPGAVVLVSRTHSVDQRYGPCITVRRIRQAASHEYDPADLMEGPSVAFDQMVDRLRDLMRKVRNPHLSGVLEHFFDPGSDTWRRWADSPAAKTYH